MKSLKRCLLTCSKYGVSLLVAMSSLSVSAQGFLPEEAGPSGVTELVAVDESGEVQSIEFRQNFVNGPVFWSGRFDGTNLPNETCGTQCGQFSLGRVEVSGDTLTLFKSFPPNEPRITYTFNFTEGEAFPTNVEELSQLTLSRDGVSAFSLVEPFDPCDNFLCSDGESCRTDYGVDVFGFPSSNTFCAVPFRPRGNNG